MRIFRVLLITQSVSHKLCQCAREIRSEMSSVPSPLNPCAVVFNLIMSLQLAELALRFTAEIRGTYTISLTTAIKLNDRYYLITDYSMT